MEWLSPWINNCKAYLAASYDESKRLYHGRGGSEQGPQHWAIEWHPGLLTVIAYQPYDEEMTWWTILCEQLASDSVTLRIQRRYLAKSPSEFFPVSAQHKEFEARVDGLRFKLDVRNRQNPGYFMDMRAIHRYVRDRAAGKQVLNLFSYTCVFSVYALSGGATDVVNMDMSKSAIGQGRQNHKCNGIFKGQFFAHNIFSSWSKLRKKGPYDLIIVDPPSYQKGSFVATKDYVRVLRQLTRMLSEEADVILCLNAPELSKQDLLNWVAEAETPIELTEWLSLDSDFVEADKKGALKVGVFRTKL